LFAKGSLCNAAGAPFLWLWWGSSTLGLLIVEVVVRGLVLVDHDAMRAEVYWSKQTADEIIPAAL
jgi:hypothetical protein